MLPGLQRGAAPELRPKEPWQSKTVLPKPHATVQFAMATVRKAFAADFLSIDNETNPDAADLWKTVMTHYLDRSHSNFPIRFTTASGMAFAIGTSMEMIPVWRQGKGLQIHPRGALEDPSHPDAFPMEPQSGDCTLDSPGIPRQVAAEAGEKEGRYQNVDRVQEMFTDSATQNSDMTPQAIAARKGVIYERSKYRKSVLTTEFWGTPGAGRQ